jgi:hypothetical protein
MSHRDQALAARPCQISNIPRKHSTPACRREAVLIAQQHQAVACTGIAWRHIRAEALLVSQALLVHLDVESQVLIRLQLLSEHSLCTLRLQIRTAGALLAGTGDASSKPNENRGSKSGVCDNGNRKTVSTAQPLVACSSHASRQQQGVLQICMYNQLTGCGRSCCCCCCHASGMLSRCR